MPSSRRRSARRPSVLVGDRKCRASPARSIDEEAHRVVLPQRGRRTIALGRRCRRATGLATSPRPGRQRLAARRQHVRRPRAAPRAPPSSAAQRFEEVLAVVEHEQRSLVRQRCDQLLDGLQPGNVMRSRSRRGQPVRPQLGRPRSRAPRTTRRRETGREAPPPTASARRVLPTPPDPVSVTSRSSMTSWPIAATSCSRPIRGESCTGRL